MTLKFHLGLFTFCLSLVSISLNLIILAPVFHLSFISKKSSIYLIAFFNIISDLVQLFITCFYLSTSIMADRYLISDEKLGEINVLFGWIFMNAWFLECIVQIVMATNRILADQAVLSYAFVRIKGVYPYSNWMVLAYDGLCTSISTLCYILVFRSIQKDKQKLTSTAQKRLIKQDIKYLVQFVFISIFYVFTWVFFEILNLIVKDVRIEFWIVVPICVTCNSSTNSLIYLTANREIQKFIRKCCGQKNEMNGSSINQVAAIVILNKTM
ncbi:hypothetical protein CAEBREN_24316 [Caenorhabditis brenneri]|uniref:7TM GPCR serpentine receptor class x (Srx) domain-containing protein n=1 Tax=Caenorhabditis brenneri TaxID=135651 RepID=G0P675_CAEBE|nr:hypothetical protein CAEBREN_24316 [Caenorhabditis brenneri]